MILNLVDGSNIERNLYLTTQDCPRYDPGDLREGLFDLLPKGVLWTGSAVCLRNLYRTFCRLQGAFPLDRPRMRDLS